MTQQNELKKCPFCGGKARTIQIHADHIIYCETCKAKTGAMISEAEAERAWNIRAGRLKK